MGEKVETVTEFLFGSKITVVSKITVEGAATMKLKYASSLEEKKSYGKTRQCIRKQRHHLSNKGPHSQIYDFSSSHVWM